MDMTNQPTVMEQVFHHVSGHELSPGLRLLLIVVLAVLVHLLVKTIRNFSEWLINHGRADRNPLGFVTQQPKYMTFVQLLASTATFIVYFVAVGLILEELGINLEAYLASASIVGLAISFGSQGLVQDVVISLTLIFSDAMDAGDLVEIAGTVVVVGRVEQIGMRFTTLRNFYNQVVFIPNRTIANVSRFPQGGVYAYADIQIPASMNREQAAQVIAGVAKGMWGQFGAIILSEPVVGPVETAQGGNWSFTRVHFKIWPGQGNLIETTFRQQMVKALQALDPDYADWQVAVTYRAVTATKKL